MADITYFFDKSAIIRRNKPVAGTDKYKLSATATIECNIQELDQDTVAKLEGTFGQEYVLFCGMNVEIKAGDRVVDTENGDQFVVKNIIVASLFGIEEFKQVYLTKFNGN